MDILDLAARNKLKRILLVRDKIDFAGALSHVTQHSCGSEPLFIEDGDYLYFLKLLKDISARFKINVFALCLMPNHIHILLMTKQANLSKSMHSLFRVYARYFNDKYKRKGHVFGGAFRQSLCLDDSYLLAASLYIHLNPLNAGIAVDYKGYRWSSCGLYVMGVNKETFVDFGYILKLLDTDLVKAKGVYRDLLDQMAQDKIRSDQQDRVVLEGFRIKLNSVLSTRGMEIVADSIVKGMLSDSEIERKIYVLKQRKRLKKTEDLQARKFIIAQLRSRGYRIAEIAEKLGLSRQTVSATMK